MTTEGLTEKYGLAEDWIETNAAQYENGTFEHEDSPVYHGSFIDAMEQGFLVSYVLPVDLRELAEEKSRESGITINELALSAFREKLLA